jgi:NADH-quinone oxidoreductase subunit C
VSPEQIAERISARWPDCYTARGEVTVVVAREQLIEAVEWLRDEDGLAFDWFADVTATDWPDRDPRFWVAYELYSTTEKHRVRVKVGLPEADPKVPTLTELYPGANWPERECYDFFGVIFEGHPDLTRIFMPDDWDGHPLRKSEPLGGVNTRFKGAFIPPVDTRTT